MKCYICKRENIEQGRVLLVKSPDVADALVFTCDGCSESNDHAIVHCNDCRSVVDVGSQGTRGGGYIEDALNENYIAYCKKCAIRMKAGTLEKKYIVKEPKKVFRTLKKLESCLKILITLEKMCDKIKRKYPHASLCIYKRGKQIVVSPFGSDSADEIIDEINETLKIR